MGYPLIPYKEPIRAQHAVSVFFLSLQTPLTMDTKNMLVAINEDGVTFTSCHFVSYAVIRTHMMHEYVS